MTERLPSSSLSKMLEILKLSLVKRKIDIQCLKSRTAFASGKQMKQDVVCLKRVSTRSWRRQKFVS